MDTLGIIRQLRADPALADELRAALLSQEFLELPERTSKLEERMAKVEERLLRVEDDLGELKGAQFEDRVRANPRRYLSRAVRGPVAEEPDDFDLSMLTEDDAEYLRQVDAVVRGQLPASGEQVVAAVEASWRAHQDDLDQATKRAPLLARVSRLPVLPLVVSHEKPVHVVVEHARAAGVGLPIAGGTPPLAEAQPVRVGAA